MPDTSLIGTTLAGNFRLTGVIGEGGMATVYRGETVKGGDEVAVKIMNPELAKEVRFVRRFRREARAAAMLKHPNTVQILEFGVDQGMVFLAMELLRGFDLAMLLHRERRIPEMRAVQIVVQVCRALSAAHEQSIIHRDLKPDNIMLVRQPPNQTAPLAGLAATDFVKVLDFGIAKILDDDGERSPNDPRVDPITQEKSMLTRVGTIVGTPAYMAPEQGRAEAVDARTDLYACGVLLYELITGRVPFTGETPMQVVMRHVNEPPRPPSDYTRVNREVEKLIMRALAKYPSERQQSAEEMAFDLLRVLPLLGAPAEPVDEDNVKKTLVLDRPAPAPPSAPLPPPRPAAGVPAVSRAAAAGNAVAHAPPTKPMPPPPPAAVDTVAAPFPTLNIEVPDDIFPAGLGAPVSAAVTSSEPLPTRRMDPPNAPARAQPPPVPKPAAPPPAPTAPTAPTRPQRSTAPIPVVVAGAERANLASTMQSSPSDSVPPASTDDEEEAPTVLKAPTNADKARMSLAEEAMAKALGQSGSNPAAPPAAIGQGLPKFSGPESVEPTLVAGAQHPQEKTRISNAPPPHPPAAQKAAAPPPRPANLRGAEIGHLKDLQATIPLEPEQVKDALDAARARLPSPPPVPAPSASPRPEREPTPLPLDKPARKPTAELIPVQLADDAPPPHAATIVDMPKAEALPVWQPKGRRLSGPTALVVGIAIGALLVAVFIGVLLLLRGSAASN